MRAAGFRLVTFSRELTAEDKARAIALNTEWDAVRAGKDGGLEIPQWPVGSIGEAYVRSMKLREKERRTRNILWTSEQKPGRLASSLEVPWSRPRRLQSDASDT
jgi:hypothetical protein